jgi:hypothetical protein
LFVGAPSSLVGVRVSALNLGFCGGVDLGERQLPTTDREVRVRQRAGIPFFFWKKRLDFWHLSRAGTPVHAFESRVGRMKVIRSVTVE